MVGMSVGGDSGAQPLAAEFWEGRYQEGTARWDLGQPAPPFVSLLESPDAPVPGRIAVLGMGRGHDAMRFAEQGFEVVGVDFAPSAIAHATEAFQSCGLTAQFLQEDIFALPESLNGSFDYVLEHTCFCAIAPTQRLDYVALVQRLLRPGGELIGLFWAHGREGGPPYTSTVEEIRQLFAPGFELERLQRVENSVPSRQNQEYLVRFSKKASLAL